MSGGEVGGALGTGLGLALAPETGGLSLAIPAAGGALGAGVGSAASGGKNPMSAALMGGLGGLLGGATIGGFDAGGIGSSAQSGLSDLLGSGASSGATGATDLSAAEGSTGSLGPTVANSSAGQNAIDQSAANSLWNGSAAPLNQVAQSSAAPASNSSVLGTLGQDLSKSFAKNPLPFIGIGMAGLGALSPSQGNKINPQQLLQNQQAMNPGFYANLPQYNFTSQTASPTSQNWYTYGQRPQSPIYTSQLQSAAQGGLIRGYADGGSVDPSRVPPHKPLVPPLRTLSLEDIVNALPRGVLGNQQAAPVAQQGSVSPRQQSLQDMRQQANFFDYARGGKVCGFAMGGQPMASDAMAVPQGAPNPPAPMPQQASPLSALAGSLQKADPQQAAMVGHKLGRALRQHIINQAMFTGEGKVGGQGGGQDDAVPAKLSQGEYVVPADVTAHLGDGSSDAGGKALDQMVHNVRAHKATAKGGFPPKSHSPLQYIKKGRA